LYFVVVILFLLLGVAMGISTVITSQIVMIRMTGDSVIAEAAAESGVEEGLYVFFTHGFDKAWVDGLSSAGNSSPKTPFSLCGETGTSDPYQYTGAQLLSGGNSMYRYRFYFDTNVYAVTAAGYYPANKPGGKDVSLRVVSASWK